MTTHARRASGWWYPWIFVGGLAVVVAVNGVMAYFAVSTWSGLETNHYFRRGAEYNKALEAAAAEKALGWHSTLKVATQAADGRAFPVNVTFVGKDGAPLDGLRVWIRAERPTSEGHDTEADLKALGGGVYAGPVVLPLPGQWSIRVLAAKGEGRYQAVRRIIVP